MPVVSVVIPTLKRPVLVLRAVQSVLQQTLKDIELIVVVDGDDPATVEALRGVSDDRLRVISHPASMGAGQARDTGADASAGDWVAFLDDDDEWLPEKLERQLQSVSDGRSIAMTLSLVVDPAGNRVEPTKPFDATRPIDEWLFDRQTWFSRGEGFLQTSSLMIPRELFSTLHFTDTKQHEEWELVIRAVKLMGYKLVTSEQPLVVYYVPGNRPSLSNTYTWRRSVLWVDGMGDLITPRAYSGFCLNVVGRIAAHYGEWNAFLPLLSASFRKGRPTLRQLLAYGLIWFVPESARRKLRSGIEQSAR